MSDTNDAIATGREGGLKSGRSRRAQGALAGVDQVVAKDLPDMTKEERAAFRRRLANAIRDIDDLEPSKSD